MRVIVYICVKGKKTSIKYPNVLIEDIESSFGVKVVEIRLDEERPKNWSDMKVLFDTVKKGKELYCDAIVTVHLGKLLFEPAYYRNMQELTVKENLVWMNIQLSEVVWKHERWFKGK